MKKIINVFRLDEKTELRFTGWMEKENLGLQVELRNRTNVYRLDEEIKPRFTGWVKEENQG